MISSTAIQRAVQEHYCSSNLGQTLPPKLGAHFIACCSLLPLLLNSNDFWLCDPGTVHISQITLFRFIMDILLCLFACMHHFNNRTLKMLPLTMLSSIIMLETLWALLWWQGRQQRLLRLTWYKFVWGLQLFRSPSVLTPPRTYQVI